VEPPVGGLHAWVCFCDDVGFFLYDGSWRCHPLMVCKVLVYICKDVGVIRVDFRNAAAYSSDAFGFSKHFFRFLSFEDSVDVMY
jgi:hypothetical protein